jgi:hypothetical protein
MVTRLPAPIRNLIENAAGTVELREQLAVTDGRYHAERNTVALLEESLAQLELAMEDRSWTRLIARSLEEFSREGLRQISAVCRIFGIKNPLIKRGLTLRQVYVWGQGVEVAARANGRRSRPGEQDVNAVIQDFLDDPDNRRTFTGAEARIRLERALGTDGNLFISLWTKPRTGRVQARILPWDEIVDVITNPRDKSEPWFYKRQWTEEIFDLDRGVNTMAVQVAYYPALSYRPSTMRRFIGSDPVYWDAPVRHVKVNDLEGWKFGVGDAYAGIDWARAFSDFLSDWAKLVKSLSRFAWRMTTPGSKAGQAKAKLGAAPARNRFTGEPDGVGGTIQTAPDVNIDAIPKTGATIDSESGRPIATMVAAALGVPVTMLLADPGQTGARATAETLDQPTQLEMTGRRDLWTSVLRDVCDYVIKEAVRAPQGKLNGVIGRDEYDRETVTLAGDTEKTIDVAWPDLRDLDPAGMVTAIVAASSTGTIPPEQVVRLLLTALGVRNVDEIVDELVDDDGNFLWPSTPPIGQGQSAVNALRAGLDPAALVGGPMAGDPAASDGNVVDGQVVDTANTS